MMFEAVIDINTNIVYEWIETLTGNRVIVPVDQWKTKSEWVHDEILELFTANPEIEKAEWAEDILNVSSISEL